MPLDVSGTSGLKQSQPLLTESVELREIALATRHPRSIEPFKSRQQCFLSMLEGRLETSLHNCNCSDGHRGILLLINVRCFGDSSPTPEITQPVSKLLRHTPNPT